MRRRHLMAPPAGIVDETRRPHLDQMAERVHPFTSQADKIHGRERESLPQRPSGSQISKTTLRDVFPSGTRTGSGCPFQRNEARISLTLGALESPAHYTSYSDAQFTRCLIVGTVIGRVFMLMLTIMFTC